MTFDQHLPCEKFTTPADVLACWPNSGFSVNSPEIEAAIDAATYVLYYMSGRQFGICDDDVPICFTDCYRNCVKLGTLWPVNDVLSVLYDGVPDPVVNYRIDHNNTLVKLNGQFPKGSSCCKCCDDPDVVVRVRHGLSVPESLKSAAKILAKRFAQECGGGECTLPDRVSSVSRQGLSMTITDPIALVERGYTGIFAVDVVLKTLNPSQLQSPAFAWSPDVKKPAPSSYDADQCAGCC